MSTTQSTPNPRTPNLRIPNSVTPGSRTDSRMTNPRTSTYPRGQGFPGASGLFSGAFAAVVPLVVTFPVAQRHIVRGVTACGLK